MSISQDSVDLLTRAVAASNPSGLHPLDEQRFMAFFEKAWHANNEVDDALLEANWPSATIAGLGGDPAKSVKVRGQAKALLRRWKAGEV